MEAAILKEILSRHQGEFTLGKDGSIRHKTIKDFRGDLACPLNVLCGGNYPNADLAKIRRDLAIDIDTCSDVVDAADGGVLDGEWREFLEALCEPV